jgi:hypothetical protein
VDALLHRSPGRHGLKALRALVDDASTSATDTQSERGGVHRRCCLAGAAAHRRLDGYAFHGTRAAFERDCARDAELQRAGYRVVRLTWRRRHREPAAVAASLHGMLASIARPWRTA